MTITLTLQEAANFSLLGYDNTPIPPQGWVLLRTSNEEGLGENGYFGAAFVKVENGTATELVIAHRGTEPTDEGDLFSDLQLSLDIAANQLADASNFVAAVNDLFFAQYGIQPASLTTHVGHSLGGYLAIHMADDDSTRAITFDNPKTGLTSTNAEIVSVLNDPNYINTAGAGEHLGTVLRLDSDRIIELDNQGSAIANMFAKFANETVDGTNGLQAVFDIVDGFFSPLHLLIGGTFAKQTLDEHSLGNIIDRLDTTVSAATEDYDITQDSALRQYVLGFYDQTGELGGIAKQVWDESFADNTSGVTEGEFAAALTALMDDPTFDAFAVPQYLFLGTPGNDILEANSENNLILAKEGDDIIQSGLGNDIIDGGSGEDTLSYFATNEGVDVDLGVGNTYLVSSIGGNGLPTGPAKDTFVGIEHVIGTSYDDRIEGDSRHNQLVGGPGNDTLTGNQGNDTLSGGLGNDRYEFSQLSGNDIIIDNDAAGEIWLGGQKFSGLAVEVEGAAGWRLYHQGKAYSLTQSINGQDLIIAPENGIATGSITIKDFDFNDGALGIGFAGESQYTETITNYDFGESSYSHCKVDGDIGNNIIVYDAHNTSALFRVTSVNISGKEGNDYIELTGGEGNDDIYGDAGDDILIGHGSLHSTYFFGGDGNDLLMGNDNRFNLMIGGNGEDTVIFSDVYANYTIDTNGGILFNVYPYNAKITHTSGEQYYIGSVEHFVFSDQTRTIDNLTTPNHAPTVVGTIANKTVNEDTTAILLTAAQIAAAFDDADEDALSYNISAGAPNWVGFDNNGNLVATNPDNDAVGEYTITLLADDGNGQAQQQFSVTVNNVNDNPTAIGTFADATINENATTVILTAAQIAAAFDDVDAGDTLTFSLGGGAPSWLTIDGSGDLVATNPDSNEVGDHAITLVADDGHGGTPAQQNVTVTVAAVVPNTDPTSVGTVDNVVVDEDATVVILTTAQIAAAFTDVDAGDTLTFSLGGGAPAWLSLDGNGNLVSTNPANNQVGNHNITLLASDGHGGTPAQQAFTVTVNNVNDDPTTVGTIANKSINEDTVTTVLTSAQIAAAFTDVDAGDTLTFSLGGGAPSWLTIDGNGNLVSTNPNNSQVGDHNITLLASDGHGGTQAQQAFTVTVNNVNDDPTAVGTIADKTVNEDATTTVLTAAQIAAAFTDVDAGDTLTFSLGGGAPAWLSLDGNGNLVSTNPANNQVGNHNITLLASDGHGGTPAQQAFTVIVNAVGFNEDPTPPTGAGVIEGTSSANSLSGGAGNDVISALAGNDTVWGNGGNDTLYGGIGNDTLWGGLGNDILYGGDGTDFIEGDEGDDLLFGAAGNDQLFGASGNDTLYGGTGNDTIGGEANNDVIYGGDGTDVLYGSTGNDIIYGDAGADEMGGDEGNDALYGGAGNDEIFGYDGNDTLYGGADNDVLGGDLNNDLLYGEDGDDELFGDGGNDTLYGGNQNDYMEGGSGNDVLYGEAGDDDLYGQNGADTLRGGGGSDSLTGGSGVDIFVFGASSGVDEVTDFIHNTDKIHITDGIFSTTTAALSAVTYQFGDALVNLGGGNSILLVGIASGSLTASDFMVS